MTLPLPFLFLNTTKATYFESSYIEQTDFSFPLSCAVSLLVDLLVSFFLEIYKLKYEGFFFFLNYLRDCRKNVYLICVFWGFYLNPFLLSRLILAFTFATTGPFKCSFQPF